MHLGLFILALDSKVCFFRRSSDLHDNIEILLWEPETLLSLYFLYMQKF